MEAEFVWNIPLDMPGLFATEAFGPKPRTRILHALPLHSKTTRDPPRPRRADTGLPKPQDRSHPSAEPNPPTRSRPVHETKTKKPAHHQHEQASCYFPGSFGVILTFRPPLASSILRNFLGYSRGRIAPVSPV